MGFKLSILIPSILSRVKSREPLIENLISQIGLISSTSTDMGDYDIIRHNGESVEIIILTDNKKLTTGNKRNLLVCLASGDYICFIDDDDWVDSEYTRLILDAIEKNKDTIGIRGFITTNNDNRIDWELSKDFENRTVKRNGKTFYERKTNHLSPVKRVLAILSEFPSKSNAEDKYYSENLNQFLKSETKIEKPIYHYRYSTKNKEYV